MIFERGQTYYNVHYFDKWLDVNDFVEVPAESKEEAESVFWAEHEDEDHRYNVQEVEYGYMNVNVVR